MQVSKAPPQKTPSGGGSIADRLRATRKRLGLTQRQLAALSDLSKTGLAQIESGLSDDPGVKTIARIADALNVARGWLAYGG